MDGDDQTGKAAGGYARAEILSPEQRTDIAKKAAQERWSNKPKLPKATHEGTLQIGGVTIPCAVLETGQRLLTQSGFMRALGRARQAKGREHYKADVNMPAFLTANNLKPFISSELGVTSSQVEFRRIGGGRAFGYPAELLPKVCDVFLDAEKAKALTKSQQHIADQAHILIRGLAHVGIAALVDEATGYQEVRDRQALQAILDAFLLKEFAAWAKRFPDEFYREIFRLRKWQWRGMKARPQVVASYTKDLVYARLAPGILKELETKNPIDESGHRKHKHHQWLTEDVGHPALAQHLHAVIGMMRSCDTWGQLMERMNRAFPKRGDTLQLPLFTDPSPNVS